MLSPHHSLFIDGLLISVQWLVNGKTITLSDMNDRSAFEYFHIEMETHEVVFAEGAPAETLLLEECRREHFANFVEYEKLFAWTTAVSCSRLLRASNTMVLAAISDDCFDRRYHLSSMFVTRSRRPALALRHEAS